MDPSLAVSIPDVCCMLQLLLMARPLTHHVVCDPRSPKSRRTQLWREQQRTIDNFDLAKHVSSRDQTSFPIWFLSR